MANSSLKLASIILGIGGVATGIGVGVYRYLNKSDSESKKEIAKENIEKSISEWLAEDEFELLKNNTDPEIWKTNWGKFIKENKWDVLPEPWNFEDYKSKKTNSDTVPQEFKGVCEKNSKLIINKKGKGEYEKVKKYCSKKTTKI